MPQTMHTADIFSQQPEPASPRVPEDDLPRDIPQVRQWLCVPPTASATPGIPQLQDFHVLLETQRGRLVWFVVNQRALPEAALLCAIARRMDSFRETPRFEAFAGELYRCEELIITLLGSAFVVDLVPPLASDPFSLHADRPQTPHTPDTPSPHSKHSHQKQQGNRLTFVKIGRADLRMLRSDFGGTPSLGSAVFNATASAEKVLPLQISLHRERFLQVLDSSLVSEKFFTNLQSCRMQKPNALFSKLKRFHQLFNMMDMQV